MGNSLRKIDLDNLWIDGGAVKSSDPVPQVTLSNGLRQKDPNAHDPKTVGKLIANRKLAPFYEGKFDEPKDSVSGRLSRVSSRNRRSVESGRSGGYARSNVNAKPKQAKASDKQSSVDKKWLTSGLLECPICLMWYPKNINVTKCCRKNICTQCFVNMKRPRQANALIACPFCRSSNLTVIYKPPDVIAGKTKKYHRSGVTCESIRPPRIIIQPQRQVYYRYAAGPGSTVQATFAAPSSQNGRQAYTFYQPRTTTGQGPYYPARYQQVTAQRNVARAPAPSVNSTPNRHTVEEADEILMRRVLALSALEY